MVSLFIACHRIIPVWEGTAPVFRGSAETQQPAVIHTKDGEWCLVFTSETESPQSEGALLLTHATELQGNSGYNCTGDSAVQKSQNVPNERRLDSYCI